MDIGRGGTKGEEVAGEPGSKIDCVGEEAKAAGDREGDELLGRGRRGASMLS